MNIKDRIPARLLAACGALVLAGGLLVGGLSGSAAGAPSSEQAGQTDTKAISARVSGGYSCDSTEWHFVITQTSDAQAPATITIAWSNGASSQVPLGRVTGGTAHYTTTVNLGSEVSSATASIATEWSGGFQVSHGPCLATSRVSPSPSPTPTATPAATPTVSPSAAATPTASPGVPGVPTAVPSAAAVPVDTAASPTASPIVLGSISFPAGLPLTIQLLPATSTRDAVGVSVWVLVLALLAITGLALFAKRRHPIAR